MTDITATLMDYYRPVKALVFYEDQQPGSDNIYIQSFDMDDQQRAINGHPFSIDEAASLARTLDVCSDLNKNYLKPTGLHPDNVLHINPLEGFAIWYTPAQRQPLHFAESLGLPCRIAAVPPLLWKASKGQVYIFALKNTSQIHAETALYEAPFFNIYTDGRVCMGNVKIDIDTNASLESFMKQWEHYFFNSYFTQILAGRQPIKGDIMELWRRLLSSQRKFPVSRLIKSGKTIRRLLK